jgi:hypothetical protein
MRTKLFLTRFFLSTAIAFGSENAAVASMASDGDYKLSEGAVVIETQSVTPTRALLLWMIRPAKHPRDTPSDPYTCPEYTRGSYYSGKTRVSLVDPQTHRVINTVKISPASSGGGDEFDLPYEIRSDYYYHVDGVAKGVEGKPTIMWLKDYNGDGKAWEFALFNAQACMGLATTLIGYSERQDKVIQYQTHLVVNKTKTRTESWTDYLFSKKPVSLGAWKYEVDSRGRGGSLDTYEIHYNKQAERFEGKRVETGGDE